MVGKCKLAERENQVQRVIMCVSNGLLQKNLLLRCMRGMVEKQNAVYMHAIHACTHVYSGVEGCYFGREREGGREGGRMYVSVVEAFLVSVGGAALNSLPYVVADDLLTFWITMLC